MTITIDLRDFESFAKQLDGAIDQVPYAISLAMNQAAKNAREVLVRDTWPRHVTQRNSTFINAALGVEQWAKKEDLTVVLGDSRIKGRGHLALHAKGGTKQARKRLAIPPKGSVRRGPHGVAKGQLPAAIIANTPKRALRITPKGIFVAQGGRLILKYAFKASANQPKDVPFYDDFRDAFMADVRTSFPAALARAMKTRRA